MDTEAYNGSYASNPFDFKHHKLTQVGVYVDGEQIPRKPLFLKFDKAGGQNFMAGFQSLFFGSGKLCQVSGNQINRIEAIMALATQRSVLTCPQTTARVVTLSL